MAFFEKITLSESVTSQCVSWSLPQAGVCVDEPRGHFTLALFVAGSQFWSWTEMCCFQFLTLYPLCCSHCLFSACACLFFHPLQAALPLIAFFQHFCADSAFWLSLEVLAPSPLCSLGPGSGFLAFWTAQRTTVSLAFTPVGKRPFVPAQTWGQRNWVIFPWWGGGWRSVLWSMGRQGRRCASQFLEYKQRGVWCRGAAGSGARLPEVKTLLYPLLATRSWASSSASSRKGRF